MSLVYVVFCELPTVELADEYERWLADDHAADVVRAGAISAEVTRLDGTPTTIETRYVFESREDFARYEAGPAVALRAEGRARFGPERGVTMRRALGELRIRRSRGDGSAESDPR